MFSLLKKGYSFIFLRDELYQLENEIIETKKDLIINVLENSKITLLGFENAILTVEYLLQNQYSLSNVHQDPLRISFQDVNTLHDE